MWCQPRNPLPSSPFCLLSMHGSNSCDCAAHHLSELSSHSFPLCAWPLSFPPSLISFLRGLGLPWLKVHSLFCFFFMHGLSSSQLNSHSLSVSFSCMGRVPPHSTFAPPSIFSLNMGQAPLNSISIHLFVLQVHEREALACAQISYK